MVDKFSERVDKISLYNIDPTRIIILILQYLKSLPSVFQKEQEMIIINI